MVCLAGPWLVLLKLLPRLPLPRDSGEFSTPQPRLLCCLGLGYKSSFLSSSTSMVQQLFDVLPHGLLRPAAGRKDEPQVNLNCKNGSLRSCRRLTIGRLVSVCGVVVATRSRARLGSSIFRCLRFRIWFVWRGNSPSGGAAAGLAVASSASRMVVGLAGPRLQLARLLPWLQQPHDGGEFTPLQPRWLCCLGLG